MSFDIQNLSWPSLEPLRTIRLENINTLPIRVSEVIANPRAHLFAFCVIVAIVIVFCVMLVLILYQIRALRGRYKEYDIYTYESDELDDEGQPIEYEVRTEVKRQWSSKRFVFSASVSLLVLMLVWVLVGASSQSNKLCLSCHSASEESRVLEHISSQKGAAHASARCVDCHEASSFLGSSTIGVLPRLAHIFIGSYKESDVPGYQFFPGDSCLKCHKNDIRDGAKTYGSEKQLRVSHIQPHEAGLQCVDCHILDETHKMSRVTTGMQICLDCHTGTQATNTCTACHPQGIFAANEHLPSTQNAQRLVTASPKDYCYRCHETKACDDCHGGFRLPHPKGYRGNPHIQAAKRGNKQSCYHCHSKDDCFTCHGTYDGL
jgi:nitrate/TMAO reductase-like tetraheme cytochrome c subunit